MIRSSFAHPVVVLKPVGQKTHLTEGQIPHPLRMVKIPGCFDEEGV